MTLETWFKILMKKGLQAREPKQSPNIDMQISYLCFYWTCSMEEETLTGWMRLDEK